MKTKIRTSIIVVVLLILTPFLFAGPIDFDNLQVASTTYGTVAAEGYPRLLGAYNNKIYFIVSEDGTTNPSKVCCYNPSDGLSNTVNHSIVKETTGKFVTLRQIDSLLYFSDNLGDVYFYDGSTVTAMSGTPFTASDYVSSIAKFKGLIYFATSTGKIFRYDGLTFEPVREIGEDRIIIDMVAWPKDGYLYVSVGPDKVMCCPPLGYVIRSSSADAGSWETVLGGNYYSMLFMPTADYLYTAVMDSAYCHCSTVRKSSVGTTFPIIYPSDGQYKRAWGSFYYDGIAYFFADDQMYGLGEIIVDDNGSVNRIANQKWVITQAVELNDEVYALASSSPGEYQGDVYLITTAPEPAIETLVDINPDSLNKNSKGQWVTVYITLPEGYDVNKIDPNTIAITSLTGASCLPDYHQDIDLSFAPQIGDRDEDGIPDLTVKFSRQELIANLCLDDVAVTVEGQFFSGKRFRGIDHIRVIDRGK